MVSTPTAAAALVVVLVTAGVSGCGSEDRDRVDGVGKVESSLSFAEAKKQARSLAQSSVAALPAGARLQELESGPTTTFCASRSAPPRGTPVQWGETYEVLGVPPAVGLADDFADGLEDSGWQRSADMGESVILRNPDKFSLELTVSEVKISLSVGTPCVKPADPDDPLGG